MPRQVVTIRNGENPARVEVVAAVESLFGVKLDRRVPLAADNPQARVHALPEAKRLSGQLDEITGILGEWREQGAPESGAGTAPTRIAEVLHFQLGSLK